MYLLTYSTIQLAFDGPKIYTTNVSPTIILKVSCISVARMMINQITYRDDPRFAIVIFVACFSIP
jgi:hypothetical protein